MKNHRKLLLILFAALLALGLFAPLAHAAPWNNTFITCTGSETGIFEIFGESDWQPLPIPFWGETSSRSIAYCLESGKSPPNCDSYSVSQALYDETVTRGIRAILLHGFPNGLGGLTETQAHYATQVAIWSWMQEAADVGSYCYAEVNLRPAAGYQAVYSYYQGLLDYARRGVDTVNYSARFNPHPVVLSPNGSGRLVGTLNP